MEKDDPGLLADRRRSTMLGSPEAPPERSRLLATGTSAPPGPTWEPVLRVPIETALDTPATPTVIAAAIEMTQRGFTRPF